MKRIFLVVMILLSGYLVRAQDASSEEEKDVNLFSFPVSPEAGRLGTYGNVPVNLSTGQMNFPVPIYTINANGYSWPISLSYNFKGLIYEDKPSVTGLGWNLQAGGVVTREVRGIPDEHPKGYYGINEERQRFLNPYFNDGTMTRAIAEDLANGNIDGEADKYYVSVNGVSFSFKVGLDKQPVYLSEHNHKVSFIWKNEYELDGFDVTDHNGIQYHFTDKEFNAPVSGNFNVFNDSFTEYVSSWNLSSVVFPNNEKLFFNYQTRDYYSYDFFASGATNSRQIQCGGPSFTPLATYNDGFSKTRITRKILTRINASTARVSFELPLVPETAADGFRVTYASIFVNDTYTNDILWDYDFSYQGARDLLMSITRNQEPFYSFDYLNKTSVPAFINDENANAFKQDLWGFYNGVNNQYGINVPGTSYESDKRPSYTHTSAGALSKITYPTGGYTLLNYEQNTTKALYEEVLNENQNFAPNWKIHLQFKSDERRGSSYKEEKYKYTFTEDVIADIKHELTALPASFSGISITKLEECTSYMSVSANYEDSATHLRAITQDPVPELCPRLYEEIDDKDIDGPYDDPITKRGSSKGKIMLSAGTYEFKIWTGSNHEPVSGEIQVRFYKPPTSEAIEIPLYTNKLVGGIRVSKLINYTGENTIASTKNFEYIDEDGYSSGKELQKAVTTYNNVVEHCCGTGAGDTANIILDHFNRLNYTSKTYNSVNLNQGVPVIYEKVREFAEKRVKTTLIGRPDCNTPECIRPIGTGEGSVLTYIGSGDPYGGPTSISTYYYTNGYTESTFNFDRAGVYRYPTIPTGVDMDMGRMINQDVYKFEKKDFSYAKISDQENQYSQIRGLQDNDGFDYNSNHPMNLKIAKKITKEGNCYYYPEDYNVFNYFKIEKYQELDKRYLVNQTVSKQYFPQVVSTTQNLSYDTKYQLKRTTTTNSEDEVIETENFYPYDMVAGAAAEMASENIVTPVIASITKRDGVVIGQSKLEYTEILPANNDDRIIFKPSKKFIAIGGEPLRGVTKYDQYDTKGNLLQYFRIIKDGTASNSPNPNSIADEGGTIISAIWGYDYKYPIAQIVNGSYDEAVSHLSITTDQLQQLDNAALRDELDKIRIAMPEAQITTYTYRPQVGVTSVTDPRGYTMYYEYDGLYRLERVKDEEGNIISENQYKYRSN